MKILGVETSCDDTGVALFCQKRGLLGHVIYSQIKEHKKYKGVVPEIASREHSNRIVECYIKLISSLSLTASDIDAVAYTNGPGLVGALMIGACFAHSFAMSRNIKKIGINHLEGHLFSCWLPNLTPKWPCLLLLVSGGHTALIYAKGINQYEVIGETLDDAAGEAFDKTAKLLGLPYPGGAHLSNLAKKGDSTAYNFTLPLIQQTGVNFSFSGLKSAAIRAWSESSKNEEDKSNLAASFEKTVVKSLIKTTSKALDITGCSNLMIAGGVSANEPLRKAAQQLCNKKGIDLILPNKEFCTDNAAMIAAAGSFKADLMNYEPAINIYPRWSISDVK